MRLPRSRFTVRRMMVAVAIIAVSVGVPVGMAHSRAQAARELAGRYRERAAFHRREAAWLLGMARSGSILMADTREDGIWRTPKISQAEEERRFSRWPSNRIKARAAWHSAVARKYEDAALDPWWPVAPDL